MLSASHGLSNLDATLPPLSYTAALFICLNVHMILSLNCLNPIPGSSLPLGQPQPLESCDWCPPPWSLPRRPVTLTQSFPSQSLQGISKHCPGPNPTPTCFVCHQTKNKFYIFKWLKKISKDYFLTRENDMKVKSVSIALCVGPSHAHLVTCSLCTLH